LLIMLLFAGRRSRWLEKRFLVKHIRREPLKVQAEELIPLRKKG